MWNQEGCERLGEPCDMLRDIHECHRQIPCGMQDGKAERAHQHDIARGAEAILPKNDGPGQKRDGQHDGDRRMEQPELFQVDEAAAACRHFPIDGGIETACSRRCRKTPTPRAYYR